LKYIYFFGFEKNREIGGRTLYRFRCSEAAGEPEQTFLFEVLPQFITNVIVKVS